MARTFKVSFPLPGRRPNSATQTTPGLRGPPSNRSEGDGSPLMYPGSKAERVLGGTDFEGCDFKKKLSRKERKSLRKYPSFISMTLAETDNDRDREEEGFLFSGTKTSSEPHRHMSPALSKQGSSPLLGEHRTAGSTNSGYLNAPSMPHNLREGSSNTLRPHYDKSTAPLLISQQTSASSARDLALRKGMPQISSRLSHNVSGDFKPTETGVEHVRRFSGDSKVTEGSKASARSKIAGTQRLRPLATDPPTLNPSAPRVFHAMSPPPALINSSLPKPIRPVDSQRKRSRWWQRSKAGYPPPSPPPMPAELAYVPTTPDAHFSTGEAHVRRTREGARNWFDGLDEDDVHVNLHEERRQEEVSQYRPAENCGAPLSISEILAKDPRRASITQTKSSFSSKSGPPDRKLSFRLDSTAPPCAHGDFSETSPVRSTATNASNPGRKNLHSVSSSQGISAGVDLRISSVLDLSSSDDDGNDAWTAQPENLYRGHFIRSSIEHADYGEDLLLGSAQHVPQIRPRPVMNKHTRRASARGSNCSATVPPVPDIPPRPRLGQRNSSLRWRQMMEEKSATTIDGGEASSTVESGENSGTNVDTPLSSPISTGTASTLHRRKVSFRGSKLMKVTSEEEKLLEAMREKRASIRHNDFQKGFKKAMQLQAGAEVFAPRPQTAGVDGRASCRHSSSMYDPRGSSRGGSRSSISPPPMLTSARYGHEPKPSLASLGPGSRMSLSTDNLHEIDTETYLFPQVPEIIRPGLRSEVSAGKPSPSPSFSPSDILPLSSSSSTRHSATTPPLGHGSLCGMVHGDSVT
ncbi:MAG: hypothetical protein Q9163_000851 [Psora crenata]